MLQILVTMGFMAAMLFAGGVLATTLAENWSAISVVLGVRSPTMPSSPSRARAVPRIRRAVTIRAAAPRPLRAAA